MYSYCSATLTEVFPSFFSVVRHMPGYNSPRRGTAGTVPIYFCVVLCIVCVQIYTVLLPPGGNPIAVNKYLKRGALLAQLVLGEGETPSSGLLCSK
jgi:hypothetical protein